ncbi:MAG: hypothetical protein ACTSP4_00220 [Candidatus Hodarchaeales archaeon]
MVQQGHWQERLQRETVNCCRVVTARELIHIGYAILTIEKLSLNTKSTHGVIAKANLSLPDESAVVTGAVVASIRNGNLVAVLLILLSYQL